jgi:hypothetical protein
MPAFRHIFSTFLYHDPFFVDDFLSMVMTILDLELPIFGNVGLLVWAAIFPCNTLVNLSLVVGMDNMSDGG